MNTFSIFLRFLERIEYQTEKLAWARSCRLIGENRAAQIECMQDEEKKLWNLIARSSSFLEYCIKKGELTEKGADECAAFLFTSSRRVMRESSQELGWTPVTTRRLAAEKVFRTARPKHWSRHLMREVA